MWCVWTGIQWVALHADWQVEEAQSCGYEVRFIPPRLGEYTPDCTVLPPYVEQGIDLMYTYLAGV